MSWREVLATANPADNTYPHNTHNTHKSPKLDNSADIADSAPGDSNLMATLATACRGLSITPEEVRDALAPGDLDDWRNGHISAGTLATFAQARVQRREMNQGNVPDHYTKRATCEQCGSVWLWCTGEFLGCPWCWSRVAGYPIPHP